MYLVIERVGEKMYSQKNITIIIVAAMLISISFLGTVDVSAATVSRSQTALTLASSNPNPGFKKQFTLSGTLTANGAPIANGLIVLYRRHCNDGRRRLLRRH
jgi:phage baseplate assembly protein gpV